MLTIPPRVRSQREVDAKDEEARDLSRKAEQMKRLCEKLQRDDTKRSETKLRRLQTDQESLKDGISLVSADTSRKRSEVQAEERAISDRGELFRSIDDNIEYKRGQAEVARVRAEAAERRGALESLGDGEALASELKARRDAHEEATRKVQYLRGSRKTLEQKIRERREELGGREFRNIQNLHRAESAAEDQEAGRGRHRRCRQGAEEAADQLPQPQDAEHQQDHQGAWRRPTETLTSTTSE